MTVDERNWQDEFNALPPEVRRIAQMVEVQHVIDALREEKVQLTHEYLQRFKHLDALIRQQEKLLEWGND